MAERGNKLNRCLDRFAGIPLVQAAALIRRCGRAKPPLAPVRIGVICLGAIGDLLLLSSLTQALALRFPAAEITLITTSANAGAVPLIPGVSGHAAFPVRNIPKMLLFLRNCRFDLLFDATQWARLGALLSAFSGAGCAVGFSTPGQYRAAAYDIAVPHRSDRHEAENFLGLGQALYPDMRGAPRLTLPEALPAGESGLAAETGPGFVYLHMWPSGACTWLKEWPQAHWAGLARELLKKGLALRLTGSKADAARNDAFVRTFFPGEQGIASLAGKTSLVALAWLLARAGAVVSVNTGIMHLAALCGAPTVGLHGATNPLRWGPVGEASLSLLPRFGAAAYLNLGFEYPGNVSPSLPNLPVEDVLSGLARLGCIAT